MGSGFRARGLLMLSSPCADARERQGRGGCLGEHAHILCHTPYPTHPTHPATNIIEWHVQVLGNCKGVIATFVSVLMFRNPVTLKGIFGYAVTLSGVFMYSEVSRVWVACKWDGCRGWVTGWGLSS